MRLASAWLSCQAVTVNNDAAGWVRQVPLGGDRVSGSERRGDDPVASTAQRWQEIEQGRRALAERLARELANPDPQAPRGALSDFVAATAVKVRWGGRNIDARMAFEDAPTTVLVGGELGRVEGRAGVVLWVHAPSDGFWSLVVPFEPFRGPVLVRTDDCD
jgi:hypothetical protein